MIRGTGAVAAAALVFAFLCVQPSCGRATPVGGEAGRVVPAASVSVTVLPEPFRQIAAQAVEMQGTLQAGLRQSLREARDGDSLAPVLTIILLSFLYGLIHAVGPGHGKVTVGSYLLTQQARLIHALAMSGVAAGIQSLSAIALVWGLASLLNLSGPQIQMQASLLEQVSSLAMVCLGLWMIWGRLTRKRCCGGGDDAGPQVQPPDCACSHGHSDPGISLGAAGRSRWAEVLIAGGVCGLRPCSGAILVLLFTLMGGIFWVGVVSVLMMGLGVAITVSAISIGAWKANRWMGKRASPLLQARAERAFVIASVCGAVVITLFGILSLFGPAGRG